MPILLQRYGAPLAALLVVCVGMLATRRRAGWRPLVGVVAVTVGWVLLDPSWRGALWPRGMVDRLVAPALAVLLVVAARGGRWGWTAAALVAGWWLGEGVPRAESWRVMFAVVGLAWLLSRAGAAQGGVAAGLTLAGGAWLAGASVWVVAGLVVAAGALAGVPGTLLAVAVVGVDLGAGRLLAGNIGAADLACIAAVAAAWAVAPVARRLARRLGRRGAWAAPVLVAVLGVGLAWVGMRLRLR